MSQYSTVLTQAIDAYYTGTVSLGQNDYANAVRRAATLWKVNPYRMDTAIRGVIEDPETREAKNARTDVDYNSVLQAVEQIVQS